jgi:hypothetical protein
MSVQNKIVVTYVDIYGTEFRDEYFNKIPSINNGNSLYISKRPCEVEVVAIYAKDTWKAVRSVED